MNSQLLLTINGWAGKNQLLDHFMIFCASYLVYIVFAVVLACLTLLAYRRKWAQLGYFFATLVVSFILLKVAGTFAFDHRPFMDHTLTQLVAHAAGKSFPSDHTTVTTTLAMGLLLFTGFRKMGFLVLGAAVLIGFARIFVGIHYPLDILGGLVTGALGGGVIYGVKWLIDRRRVVAGESEG